MMNITTRVDRERMRMRELLSNSFYRRLQFTFIILILLPTFLLTLFSYSVYKDILVEKQNLSSESVMNFLEKDIEKLVDDIAFSSQVTVSDNEFKKALAELSAKKKISSYNDFKNFNKIKNTFSIAEMKTLNHDIDLFVVNNSNFIIPSFRNSLPLDMLQYDWEQISKKINYNQTTYLQWLGRIDKSDTSRIYFSRVIQDATTKEYIGSLNIGVDEVYFYELFNQVETGNITLYDNSGNQMFNYEKIPSGQSFHDLVGEKTITKYNWELNYSIPGSELTGELSSTFYRTLLIMTIFVFVFLLLSLLLANKMYDPLKKLQQVAYNYGKGNRSVRYTVEGGDEIAKLGQTMNEMFDQIEVLILNIEKEKEKQKNLEIQALFSQIRPHFLMNTLNSIRCNLDLSGDQYHSDKILSLMRLMRKYLKANEPSTLKEECDLLIHYVDIMMMKNDIIIHLDILVPEDLEEVELPFLSLQPIVENAIIHGFVGTQEGTVTIHVYQETNELVIHVTDDGVGMTKESCHTLNNQLEKERRSGKTSDTGVGLSNIVQRFHLIYGFQAKLFIESERGNGTTVEIRLPLS